MATLLNTTDPNNRLIEALGSAALFSDNTSASSPLGLPLNVLDLAGITDAALDPGQADATGPVAALPDIGALLGAADGTAGLTDGLPTDQLLGGLPLIGGGEAGGILSGLDLGNLGLGNIGGIGGTPGIPGASTTPLDIAGQGTTLQPVFDATNALVKDVHYILEALSDQVGLPNTVHAITALGETIGLGEIGLAPSADGSSNLITDTLNLPGDILSGNLNGGIANLGHDLTETIHGAANVVNNLLFGGQFPQFGDDPANPLPEIIGSLGHTLQNLPLLTIGDGNNGNGGLLSGIIGDLSHSSSGHLVDADVGPQQSNGLIFDLLSTPGGDQGHTASVNAVDVGPNGPQLLDLGLLTGSGGGLPLPVLGSGGGLALPILGGSGADGLAGNVLGGEHGLLGGNLLGGLTGGTPGAATSPLAVTDALDIVPAIAGGDHGLLHSIHII